MKKFLGFVGAIFISTFAIAHTINWHVGDQIISTTTCDSGDNITPPTAPAKRGYHLKKWGIPDYIQLEYIESTGTQYIAPNITVSDQTEIQMVGNFTYVLSPNNAYQLFGADAGGTQALQFGITDTEKWFLTFGSSSGAIGGNADTNEHTFVIKKEGTTANFYIDNNVAVSTTNNFSFGISTGFFVFRRVYGGHTPCWSWFKMKRFKIYNSGILVCDMVPAKRGTDNAIGMYDMVTNTFLTNQGTGVFIAGPAVGDL